MNIFDYYMQKGISLDCRKMHGFAMVTAKLVMQLAF